MFFDRCLIAPQFLLVFFCMFPGFVFAGDSVSLIDEALEVYRVEQDYLNKSLISDWKNIYERQHPKYRKKVSLDEFIFYDGKVESNYRTNIRAHVSGGYTIPTLDYIKENAVKKDILGFPAPRIYLMTTNPLVKVRKFVIEKIEISEDKKYAKSISRYIGQMKLNPAAVRGDIKIPFNQEMVNFWEKVDDQWFVSILRDVRNISGNSFFYFIPNDGSKWDSMKFISFPVSQLLSSKS